MHIQGPTADTIYLEALRRLQDAPIQEGRGEPTKELMHVMCELTNPRNRLVSVRDINPAFAFVEVLWIMAGGNNVKYLEFWNPRMKNFADGNLLWGAYGHRLGCAEFWSDADWEVELDQALYLYNPTPSSQVVNQLGNVREVFEDYPNSRQMVLQIWNAEADLPNPGYNYGAEKAKDIPCNLLSHLLVRDGKLHWLQVMRSNDAVWGWPYNIIQFTFLQEIMAGWLGLDLGPFVLLSDSFHTYKKHWDNLPKIIDRAVYNPPSLPRVQTNSYALPFDNWKRSFAAMIESAYNMTICPLGEEPDCITDALNDGMSMQFYPLMGMLAAEADRIKGEKLGRPEAWYYKDLAKRLMKGSPAVKSTDTYWYNALLRWWDAKEKGVII